MPRPSSTSKSPRHRLKALPWAALLRAGIVIRKRWRTLSDKERARLTGLVRDSRGRPSSLSPKDRKELHRLAGKLDLKGMARELMPPGRGRRRRRKRRCPVP